MATNIEEDLSQWNFTFSEKTITADIIIREQVIKNNTQILKRKYTSIRAGFFALGPRQRRMKRELSGLFAIETSDTPELLHVAAEGFSFGFYQGLAQSVASASKNSIDPYDLLNSKSSNHTPWGSTTAIRIDTIEDITHYGKSLKKDGQLLFNK